MPLFAGFALLMYRKIIRSIEDESVWEKDCGTAV